MSELSPWLKEILTQFLTNYTGEGGVDACRTMVNDLAAEAELASAMSRAAEEMKSETLVSQDEMPQDTLVEHVATLNGFPADAITAKARHSFAIFLLETAEKAAQTS